MAIQQENAPLLLSAVIWLALLEDPFKSHHCKLVVGPTIVSLCKFPVAANGLQMPEFSEGVDLAAVDDQWGQDLST